MKHMPSVENWDFAYGYNSVSIGGAAEVQWGVSDTAVGKAITLSMGRPPRDFNLTIYLPAAERLAEALSQAIREARGDGQQDDEAPTLILGDGTAQG